MREKQRNREGMEGKQLDAAIAAAAAREGEREIACKIKGLTCGSNSPPSLSLSLSLLLTHSGECSQSVNKVVQTTQYSHKERRETRREGARERKQLPGSQIRQPGTRIGRRTLDGRNCCCY